jgi:hypothetical protein
MKEIEGNDTKGIGPLNMAFTLDAVPYGVIDPETMLRR